MSAVIPFWTNTVDALPFSRHGRAAGSPAGSSLSLSQLLDCDAGDRTECWREVLLANYLVDFSWVLQTAPQLRHTTGQIVILSGEKGTATVDAAVPSSPVEPVRYTRRSELMDNINPVLSAARAAGLRPSDDPDKVVVLEPPLPIPYGTHHSKFILAVNERGLRVAVFTANFIHCDWHCKSQGIFVQDFQRIVPGTTAEQPADARGDAFKAELLQYLRRCGLAQRAGGHPPSAHVQHFSKDSCLDGFDFSTVRVSLVASVPGSHGGAALQRFGLHRLSSLVKAEVPADHAGEGAPGQMLLSWQYSSQGSLSEHFLTCLQAAMLPVNSTRHDVKVIFPTEDEVRSCLEGWRGGLSVPVQVKNCHEFINARLHKWGPGEELAVSPPPQKACRLEAADVVVEVVMDVDAADSGSQEADGESQHGSSADPGLWRYAIPHLKSYAASEDGRLRWFLLTSANLSQAAWGCPTKAVKDPKLFMRSYELGVFYTPDSDVVTYAAPDRHARWDTITPSCPIALPSAAASRHLFTVPIGGRENSHCPATIFLPYDIMDPVPYASTAALRAAQDGVSPPAPTRVSRIDVPWVVDMPHRGTDSLGKVIVEAVIGYSQYGEAGWFAPLRTFISP